MRLIYDEPLSNFAFNFNLRHYTQAKPAALCVSPGGILVATNHSAKVGLDDWLEIVERCAKKAGRAVVSTEVIAPEADDDDYPTFEDGKRPLKVAAFTLE